MKKSIVDEKRRIMRNAMWAMRYATPKDTGNLAYSSLRGYVTRNGIKIIYDGKRAPYGKILNQTIYREVKSGNYKRLKRNKHFGWHARAHQNALKVVLEEMGAKKTKKFNTRQNYRFRLDTQQGREARRNQYEKTLNNQAIQRYERENKGLI